MYFPLQVGDVVIRKCEGNCEEVPAGWVHLSKETNDDAIFRMVTETQPGTNRAQRRAAKHKHRWVTKTNGMTVCNYPECGAVNESP